MTTVTLTTILIIDNNLHIGLIMVVPLLQGFCLSSVWVCVFVCVCMCMCVGMWDEPSVLFFFPCLAGSHLTWELTQQLIHPAHHLLHEQVAYRPTAGREKPLDRRGSRQSQEYISDDTTKT